MLKPGDNVDSWCGKCKLILAHTIEAMVGEKPARVSCNTCRAQHVYKSHAPGSSSRQRQSETGRPLGLQPERVRASRYQTLLRGKDIAAARTYSPQNKYLTGEVIQHPSFGLGVTTSIKDETKIEVLFEGGLKVLVHGK